MASLIEEVYDSSGSILELQEYNKFMDKENLVDSWFLTGTPITLVILTLYLVAIVVGKKLMADRTPYRLKNLIRLYDLVLIFFNLYLIKGYVENPGCFTILLIEYCTLDTVNDDRLKQAFLYYGWGFLASKILDLGDTIFLVLRKKNSHISFLHVYHHFSMVFFSWVTLRYVKAFQGALPGFINICVHIIMYTYYFLATYRKLEPYLWWKKYLTKLQMAQFVFIIFYLGRMYYNGCPISGVFTFIWVFNVFAFLCLFLNFYINAYVKPQDKKEK